MSHYLSLYNKMGYFFVYRDFLFDCVCVYVYSCLAASKPILGDSRRYILSHLIAIIPLLIFDVRVIGKLVVRLGPSARLSIKWVLRPKPSDLDAKP